MSVVIIIFCTGWLRPQGQIYGATAFMLFLYPADKDQPSTSPNRYPSARNT